MITVHVRKQGGAAIITIPSDVLKMLHIGIGASLELDVTKKGFTARPAGNSGRKRYTMSELLHGATPRKMKALHKEIKWVHEGKTIGREF